MPSYNFKRNVKLFLVFGGYRYQLDIYPDVSVSQTFNEIAVKVKTLHNQINMFDKAVITKANPANFNFTIPLLTQADLKVVSSLLIDYAVSGTDVSVNYFDLYVVADTETYMVEKAVIENGIFQIVRDRLLSLNVSGTASKLSKFTGAIPGTPVSRSSISTYVSPAVLQIEVGGITKSNVTSVSLELKNDVSWLDNDTIHSSLSVTGAADSIYPAAFVVSARTLSGSVQQYVTNENSSQVNSWSTAATLRIRTGTSIDVPFIDVNIPSVVYTNRLDMQDLLTQSYDFRMTHNPTDLSTVIKIA